jgi:hypothetical protein
MLDLTKFVDIPALAKMLMCSISKVRLLIKKAILTPVGWWSRRTGVKRSMWFDPYEVEAQLTKAAAAGRVKLVDDTWKVVGARA